MLEKCVIALLTNRLNPRKGMCVYFSKFWRRIKGCGKGCAHFYMNLGDSTQNLVKKIDIRSVADDIYIAL